jgi:RNA polymerase sigma-70 factor (ECF subfamily)
MVDEELAGLASSDPLAFAEIYERYVDGVYGYCARRLGSREIAEDATSLIFSRALAAIGRFQPKSTVRSWLFTIAHNVITDQYRNSAKTQEFPLDESWDAIDHDPTPEDIAILKEHRDMVHQLLNFLTPDQRRVVELRLADLTGPEIQEVLGKSRPWVNTTQFRAVQRMRTALDELEGGSHV